MTTPNGGSWDIGGGGDSFPFDNVGDWVKIKVREYEPNLAQTDMNTGEPRTFKSGQQMLMHRVGGVVVESSGAIAPGDTASVYIKGGRKLEADGCGSTQAAIAAAIKAATAGTVLAYDSELTVQFAREGAQETRGHNPPKLYKAWYVAPSFNVDPGASPAPTAAPPAAPAPAPAPVAPPIPTAAPTVRPTPTPPSASAAPTGPTAASSPTVPAPGLTPEQEAQLAALQAQAAPAAWDSDPRVAPLRAKGVADDMIRTVLGI